MNPKIATILIAASLLASCAARDSWLPWSTAVGGGEVRIPAGATAYACDGGKRLLVRFQSDTKSAWVIYPDREFRLDRVASTSWEEFTNGRTFLVVKDGQASLREDANFQFSGCKVESR